MADNDRLRIEYVPLDELLDRFAPDNPKLHDLEELEASMERFGFVAPSAIDEATGQLLFGHGRLEKLAALRQLNRKPPNRVEVDEEGEWLVPTIRGVRLGPKRGKLYRIADNKLVELGGYHQEKLFETLRSAFRGDPQDGDLDGVGVKLEEYETLKEAYEGDLELTEPKTREEPNFEYDHYVEVFVDSTEALERIMPILEEWTEDPEIAVNIA